MMGWLVTQNLGVVKLRGFKLSLFTTVIHIALIIEILLFFKNINNILISMLFL